MRLGLAGVVAAGASGCWPFVSDRLARSRWDVDGDGVERPADCDDADPGVTAVGTWCPDGDGDGAGDGAGATEDCGAPGPGWTAACGDCDDADPASATDCAPGTTDSGTLPACGPLAPALVVGEGAGEAGVTLFTADGSASMGDGVEIGIDWGDGARDAGASADHVYASAGWYPITATATDRCGRSAAARGWVAVSEAGALLVVTTATDEGDPEGGSGPWLGAGLSLREAVGLAAVAPGPQVITFAAALGPIGVGAGFPAFDDAGTVTGRGFGQPPVVLDGSAGGRIVLAGEGARIALVELTSFVDPEGAIVLDGAASEVVGVTVRGSAGPGVVAQGVGVSVVDVVLEGNGDSEVAQLEVLSDATITRVAVGGSLGAGVGVRDGADGAHLTQLQVFDQLGDGVLFDKHADDVVFTDATVVGNGGDGVYVDGPGAPTLDNLVVAFNTGWGVAVGSGPGPTLPKAALWANGAGDCERCAGAEGWLLADPRLVDREGGDLGLAADSPAIDAGGATGVDRTVGVPGDYWGQGPDLGALEAGP